MRTESLLMIACRGLGNLYRQCRKPRIYNGLITAIAHIADVLPIKSYFNTNKSNGHTQYARVGIIGRIGKMGNEKNGGLYAREIIGTQTHGGGQGYGRYRAQVYKPRLRWNARPPCASPRWKVWLCGSEAARRKAPTVAGIKARDVTAAGLQGLCLRRFRADWRCAS